MEQILVPVDFSPNSENALRYALQLAGHVKAGITVLNAYKVYSTTGMFMSVEKYMKEEAQESMDLLLDRLRADHPEGPAMQYRIFRGDAISIIVNYADQYDQDLILMGTKGASGLKEVFAGSNTAGVIRQARQPVMAIPGEQSFETIRHIVLAVDSAGLSSDKVLAPLRSIAMAFQAKIQILHIARDSEVNAAQVKATIELKNVPHEFISISGDQVNEAINQHADSFGAQLLCMIRRKRSFIESLFHSSATQKEVFDSPVPLLILHD